ncbi:glycerol-1-phosphate dehydrogenase [NAD(P)+] [Anaerolineales bacterium]|nr:glycerol-1-phosphate dehydrogenase [NAD(P)+] [Anaerolineales bacterium]
MHQLPYDPADGVEFWEEIRKLPGFPAHETMPIKHMIFESGALFKTSDILKSVGVHQNKPLIVVMDETSKRRDGRDLQAQALDTLRKDGWQVRLCIMPSDESGQVHTDMPHIQMVQKSLSTSCAVLSIGSGVVTDIAKHGCFLYQQETGEKVPFVVVQTANSVSAYTSNMSPTFVDGVKRTLDSRYPDALICDLETLRDAPYEMTVGGVGDMLAVFVSFPDWYLAHRLGMDSTYSELAKNLVGPLGELLLEHAEGIRTGKMESVAMLAKIIALGGLAMSLSHATTPMSGFEHVMSHVLDLQAEIEHTPLAVHGSQVALATLAGAEMYRCFLADFDPRSLRVDECYPSMDLMKKRVESGFAEIDPSGKAGMECWADYSQKLEKWHAHRKDFESVLKEWDSVRAQLQVETCPPETIRDILQAVEAPTHWSQLNPPVDEKGARFAFMHASLMRKRLTLGDLLIFMNWDRETLWNKIWKDCA